jgi:hypothetical protein
MFPRSLLTKPHGVIHGNGIKGNTGKAKRDRMIRNSAVGLAVIGVISVFVLAVTVTTGRRSSIDFGSRRKKRQLLKGMVGKSRSHPQVQHNSEKKEDGMRELAQGILEGHFHLVNIGVSVDDNSDDTSAKPKKEQTYQYPEGLKVYGEFCHLQWQLHKENPAQYPMFHSLMANSPDCAEGGRQIDLAHIVSAAREYDKKPYATTHVLNLTGVVFHESRCGSTLVANMLAGVDPAKHRVYSESGPPYQALYSCGEDYENCSRSAAIQVLRDVIYLMSRSSRSKGVKTDEEFASDGEERVFFKVQSMGARHMSLFAEAFPQVPFIFVYRDPVQVLMSHFAHGPRSANCLRTRSSPPKIVRDLFHNMTTGGTLKKLSVEEYCALHLASITRAAQDQLLKSPNQGLAVNYNELPQRFYDDILPKHWLGVPSLPEEGLRRIQQVATTYSKAGNRDAADQPFQPDSKAKEEHATEPIKQAAQRFLQPSFDVLETIRHRLTVASL